MVLDLRKRQTEAVVKFLNFNGAYNDATAAAEVFKVLVIDDFTLSIVATLLHTEALRQHGVTLVLAIDKDREAIKDAPVVYFIRGTTENAQAIVRDLELGLYREAHVNFVAWAPRTILEALAAGAVKAATCTIAKVFDQHLNFIALESNLFTLCLPDSYVLLNDNTASEQQVTAAVNDVVEGLFAVSATLGTVPIIRCAAGGLAEAAARALSSRIAAHLKGRGAALFSDPSAAFGAAGKRPLLCLFDRNFDLTPMVEQPFTYKALVHDCKGLHRNKVTLKGGADGKAGATIEVGEDDAFWQQNGHQEFGIVASSIDEQLKKYQEVMTALSQRSVSGGDGSDASEAEAVQEATKALMTTVKSLPELRAQKKKLDNHMNLLYGLLTDIKARTLDRFHDLGQAVLSGSRNLNEIRQKLTAPEGTASDKLRLAVLFLLVAEKLPEASEIESITAALRDAGAEVEAFQYVFRMRQMNLTGAAAKGGGGAAPDAGSWGLPGIDTSLMSGLAGQFGKHLTKLVGGTQQAQLVTAVGQLMEGSGGKQGGAATLADSYVQLDPRQEAGKGGTEPPQTAAREAIVFMIGGGNYLERERLAQWAAQCTPKRSVVYGATELLTGAQFSTQLALLGRKSGAAA